jgi:hypothetical protein
LSATRVWRESPSFSEPECAALALMRIAGAPDPVGDAIWASRS